MNKFKTLKSKHFKNKKALPLLASLVMFTVLCGTFILQSSASVPYVSVEPENSNKFGVSVQNDIGASGGKATSFSIASANYDLLPGDELWNGQVPSFIFGVNNAPNYGSPNVDNTPSVQNYLKESGMTLMRIWISANNDHGYYDIPWQQKIDTAEKTGMTCMATLLDYDNIEWMKEVVRTYGDRCNLYLISNEPDVAGEPFSSYISAWNAAVPQLRAINPNAKFGGPVAAQADWPYVEQFIQATGKTGGVMPDFIDYHYYPCWNATNQQECLTWSVQNLKNGIERTRNLEMQHYGRVLPTGISEYNYDSSLNFGSPNTWWRDPQFMFNWQKTVLQAMIDNKVSYASLYNSMNFTGYGAYDIFTNSPPHSPTGQFWGMVDSIKKNGGSSTLIVPNPLPTASN
jgi:hypothetical protein